MQICSVCSTQTPDNEQFCPTCHADLRIFSNIVLSLKHLKENSRVNNIRVIVNQDCCPSCRQNEGTYTKETVPHLPTAGCSSKDGCRCHYEPALKEIFP